MCKSVLLLFLGIFTLSAQDFQHVEVELGTASAFNRVLPGYVGFVLSFQNQAPLWNATSIITIDLEDPDFVYLVKSLAPALVRVGGGSEWEVVMDVHGTECEKAKVDSNYCLTMDRWKDILQFAKKTGIQLIWGLGAQNRLNHSSPLNFTNINDFLHFTANLGEDILAASDGSKGGLLGFELGNELDGGDYTTSTSVDPRTFADDYKNLRLTIDNEWLYPVCKHRPLLVGPAMHIQATWERRFLAHLGRGVLDLFSFHVYVLYGLDPLLSKKVMDPVFLDAYWDQAAPVVELAKALQPGADIMIGETSAAWHSGQCGVTDRFYGSFWYADVLGRSARGGIQGFARHNFNGGCYAMINRADMKPNPDWWIGKIWSELMSEEVLDLRKIIDSHDISNTAKDLRMYAHKAKRFPKGKSGGSGAVLVFINLGTAPGQTFSITLSDYSNLMAPRNEYRITAYQKNSATADDLLSSRELALNGVLLQNADQIIDNSLFVNDSSIPIIIRPFEILFIELIDAKVY